jgi:hypothetical protein
MREPFSDRLRRQPSAKQLGASIEPVGKNYALQQSKNWPEKSEHL